MKAMILLIFMIGSLMSLSVNAASLGIQPELMTKGEICHSDLNVGVEDFQQSAAIATGVVRD